MMTAEMVQTAVNDLREYWNVDGDAAGDRVILACIASEPLSMTFDEFLHHCTACGGNWGGMLLSGLRELRPAVWDVIPDNMGAFAWACICDTLVLLDVATPD